MTLKIRSLLGEAKSSTAISSKKKLSEAEQKGIEQGTFLLQHKTPIKHLPEILKSGRLIPRDLQVKPRRGRGGSGEFIYLEPYYTDRENNFLSQQTATFFSAGQGVCSKTFLHGDLSCAAFMYSVNLLSRNDYHCSPIWDYGNTYRATFAREFKAANYPQIGNIGEICFRKPIDFKDLIGIWIHPLRYDEVVTDLNKAGLAHHVYRLQSFSYHPSITFDCNNNLQITDSPAMPVIIDCEDEGSWSFKCLQQIERKPKTEEKKPELPLITQSIAPSTTGLFTSSKSLLPPLSIVSLDSPTPTNRPS